MIFINITKKSCYKGNLLLVSPEYPVGQYISEQEMVPALKEEDKVVIDGWAAIALERLIKSVHIENEISLVSGYRTRMEQERIWEDTIRESGLEFTKKYVAVPGHSEHETGLAIDLARRKENIDFICPEFPYTGIFLEFRKKAPQFGFIERYVKGKENVTGIGAEPWHFRYVGCPHSLIMTEKGLALEEYIKFLKEYTDLERPYVYHSAEEDVRISYISVKGDRAEEIQIENRERFTLSGTNEGGVVLSRWKRH